VKYSEKQIEALIAGIEDGSINAVDLPFGYFKALTDYMTAAVFEGFGASIDTAPLKDVEFLKSLVDNVYQFGAAKTYAQVKELSGLLVDEDGKLRTSSQFRKLAREMYDNWNENWGKTEYTTAVAQADSAAKWQQITEQADVLPMLTYDAIIDKNTSDICRPLEGLTAPVNDPIWRKVAPINHFNCRCILIQSQDAKPSKNKDRIAKETEDKMQPMFVNNVGITGEIFPKSHPYFEDQGYLKSSLYK